MSAPSNPRLPYRPLLAGVAITSSSVGMWGTLGCFGVDDRGRPWGLTAAHVLALHPGDPPGRVFQPDYRVAALQISAGPARVLANVDVAAFPLDNGINARAQLLELGAWHGVASPVAGARVWKVGMATGVTQARIGAVEADGFDLLPEPGMPQGYAAFDVGDSGAAWLSQDLRLLIGIHVAQNPVTGIGRAARLDRGLSRLGLTLFA